MHFELNGKKKKKPNTIYQHLLDALKAALKERRTILKKDLHDPVNQDGVITYLEPETLE